MDDNFRQTLTQNNTRLVYTNNKKLALSCKEKSGRYTIYANRIFFDCPEEITAAVMNLYIMESAEAYKDLSDFVKRYNPDFTVKPGLPATELVELAISEISVSHSGNAARANTDPNTIRAEDDDMLELDIVVGQS